jgi:hypothetical protein
MKHLVLISSAALLVGTLLPLAAQEDTADLPLAAQEDTADLTLVGDPQPTTPDDPVQEALAKAFAARQESSVKLSITRKVEGKDRSFEVPAVSLDGKGLIAASLDGIESGGDGIMAGLQFGGPGDDEGEGGLAKPDKGELTRVALLRADATEAEADLLITDAALDLALIRVRPGDDGAVVTPAAPPAAQKAPALLDNVLAIERKGAEFQRIAGAELLQVAAVLATPRRLYVPSSPLPGGIPVYNLAGELLGMAATIHGESMVVPTEAIRKLAASLPAKATE